MESVPKDGDVAAQVSGSEPLDKQSNNDSKNHTDRLDKFALRVKSEFLLSERSPLMAPFAERPDADPRDGQKDNKKKNRGMNKKRSRDAKVSDEDRVCLSVVRGEECPYGEKCKYNHDLKEILANRLPDIKEVEGGCPNFNLKGYCEYGMMCRFGSSHLNMSTGKNLRSEDADQKEASIKPVMNILRKDVQIQLRKKKYPFKCKRHFEKKTGSNGAKEDTSPKVEGDTGDVSGRSDAVDTPQPTKRKLIDFRNKVYVAPLTTVGNLPFRRIMKKFGADITCGEMAIGTNVLEGKPTEWALLKRHPDEDIFGVQIASGHADQFARTCELLEAETTVDFVDLNLGCPLDLVCNKGAGAALMLRDKRLKECLEGITSALSCPFTIKIRTGWDESKPVAHQLIPKVQKWGIDGLSAVMIHGRSRLQRYSKLANWDYIAQVASSQDPELPRIPIIGNGDIFSYTEYEEKVAREGINATAMLARGALVKPWLPTEIKERRHWDISASERLDLLKDYVKFGLEHWGSDQKGVNSTRRFLLEWLSFLHRYVPVGLLEVVPQAMNERPPLCMCGRNDLETLMLSSNCADWVKITEMLLGPVAEDFKFEPKHKANGYK